MSSRRRTPRAVLPALLVLVATLSPLSAHAAEARLVVASPSPVPSGDAVVAPPTTSAFDVALRQPNAGALQNLLSELTTLGSSQYRHFLTTREFARRFGAPPSEASAVRSYFTSFGLTVGPLSRGHILLHVSGPSVDVAHAFATALIGVSRHGHSLGAQFAASATLPSPIAHDVRAIAGLDTVVTPHAESLHPYRSAHEASVTTCAAATGGAAPTSTTPNSLGGYTLQQQAQLYGLASAYANGFDGTGQTIAVYELEGYNPTDVSSFASCYGITPHVTNVNVDGGATSSNGQEATLDVEEALGLAPGASITVYAGPNNSTGPTDIYQRIADDNTASVVTTSWGTCEGDPTGAPAAEQAIFEQMTAQGQTIIASSGDSGSSDCNGIVNNQPAVDDPASQPFVTGVGGLTVSNISPLSETVWNDGQGTAGGGAGGGGISQLWSRPTWQNAPGITASETMRLVPDLSVMADPGTGFIEYYPSANGAGGWGSVGGTSIGSPLVASLVAVGAQSCGVSRLGFINPALYQMATTGFIDVTTGNNDLFGVGVYNAGPGYDMASGLGSPNPQTFLAGLCPPTLDASKTTGSVSSAHVAVNTTSTVNFTLRDQSGQPLPNVLVAVDATASAGRVLIDADHSSIAGNGRAHYSVTTDATGSGSVSVLNSVPGPVSVTVSYQGQALYSTVITVLATGPTTTPLPRPVIARVSGLARALRVSVRVAPLPTGQTITRYQYSLNGGRTWLSVATPTFTVGALTPGIHQILVRYLVNAHPSPVSAPVRVMVHS